MTSKEFIGKVQSYFEKQYNHEQAKRLHEWLEDTRSNLGRQIMYRLITERFNGNVNGYPRLPMIADFAALSEETTAEAERVARKNEPQEPEGEPASPEEIAEIWAKLGDKNAD